MKTVLSFLLFASSLLFHSASKHAVSIPRKTERQTISTIFPLEVEVAVVPGPLIPFL